MKINKKFFSRLSLGALLAAAIAVVGNPAQAANFKKVNINFDENVGVGNNPLNGGTKLDELWEQDYGLRMDSNRKELWLYDSDCEGSSCTGDDPDLGTGKGQNGNLKYKSPEEGKVLIIQENKGEADDYANRKKRGTITFDFTDQVGVLFNSIKLLDFDDPGDPIFSAVFADGSSTGNFTYNTNFFNEIDVKNNDRTKPKNKKRDNKFVLKDNNPDSSYISEMKILSTSWDGNEYVTRDNSLREYKFDFSGKKVTQFNLTLPGSGAITGLNYARLKNKFNFAKKVPEPTSILGLVGVSAAVASSLKRKRKSSNIELIR